MAFLGALLIGTLTGVLTGAGIGGGTLLVLYLTMIGKMAQGAAQGVNLLYFLVTAPPALYYHFKAGRIEIKEGAIAAGTGCVFAVLGVFLSTLLPEDMLRRGFGLLWVAVGLRELFYKAPSSADPDSGFNRK